MKVAAMVPDILTPEQVAEYLHLNKTTVYRLIRDRKLAATRIGRTWRIPREDLDTFMQANSTRPEVIQSLFERALSYAERENPEGDSDEILEWLEQIDEEHKQQQRPAS